VASSDASVPELRQKFGPRASDAPERRGAVARDASHVQGDPRAVVAPRSTEEVAWLVRWARKSKVPLVARGAGTSLDGESAPLRGSVVVDLSGWTEVLEVDPVDRIARVQPGVINFELHRHLSPSGLFFPANPGSWTTCTIGGNVATNASGPRSFRYGPTRNWIRAAEVVLGTGEVVRVGTRAPKRSIGPDLLQLLVGSEGTLGILTEITVALAPRPSRRAALAVAVPAATTLGPVVAHLAPLVSHGLAAIEYLDDRCADALRHEPGAQLPGGGALLLLEVESHDVNDETGRLERLSRILKASGLTEDPVLFPDADRLWTLRGASGTALDRALGERVREDIGVPISRVDELLAEINRIATAHHVVSAVYGHLGEGSLHPNFVVAPGTEEGEAVRGELLAAAVRLGGTISAEHGIGSVKSRWIADQVGAEGVRWLREVKRTCDPDGILNPGKIVD